MSDGSKLFENLNFLIVVTKFEQLESIRPITDLLKRNSCQICIVHKCFDTKSSTTPEDLKLWFANDVTEGNTVHFIISEDINFPFYRVASVDFLIPVVRPDWIYTCIENRKHARTSLFSPDPRHIFKEFQIYVSRHSFNNSEYLFYTEAVHALGGTCVDFLSNKTTHLVTKDPHDPGILAVLNFGKVEPMKFVYPTWIIQSFKQISVAPEDAHKISPNDSDSSSRSKLEDIWGRLNDIDFKVTSNIWENHSFIIGMDISLNRDLYSTLIEFLQANGGTVHRHLDESDIAKTKADCYIGKSVSSREYEVAEKKKLHLGNLIWIFYMWSLNKFSPPMDKLIFSPFKRKLLETNQLITAYTNFFGQQRFYIQRLVNALGGFTTSELSRRNTHLLCRFPFGKKFETAKKWGDKCVITNYLWLEECYRQSTRLDPLKPCFQKLPVEGGLHRTLGQMKWDNSESPESHVECLSEQFNQEESKIQNRPLPSQNDGQDAGSGNEEQPTPELQPMAPETMASEPMAHEPVAPEPMAHEPVAPEPMAHEHVAPEPMVLEPIEQPIDTNEHIKWAESNEKEENHTAQNHVTEDREKSNSIPQELGNNYKIKPDIDHPEEIETRIQEASRNTPVPLPDEPVKEKGNFETTSNLEGTVNNEPNIQERKPLLEHISNEQSLPINQNEGLNLEKPQEQTQGVNNSTERKQEDSQENSQKDLQKTKVLQEDMKSTESLQKPNAKRLSVLDETTGNKVQEQDQPQGIRKESRTPTAEQEQPQKPQEQPMKPMEQREWLQEPRERHKTLIEKNREHEELQEIRKVDVNKLGRYQQIQEEPKVSTEENTQVETSPQLPPESPGESPVPSRPANENPNRTKSTDSIPSEVPKNVQEPRTNEKIGEVASKSQTPPSTLTPTSFDQIHSSQGSRRAAKTKAARKLHDDIESLNEFQRNNKRKKTGNLLPEEIAKLEKRKALEIEAKGILLRVLPEENEITKNDVESEAIQQHRQKKLPYHINAVSTGLSDNISELDQTILRLLGITIHNEITNENLERLDGVIAPKKLRTAKFLKSLSFHPLRYALTPKFLKDILRIVHKGKKANLSLDLSRYYIPDTDHGKIRRLTSLPNKVFERAGILSVNIISDIPGGIDIISSILKAHGVKETKSIPATHMNRLSLEDFSLNDANTEATTEVPLNYIFLVNKATQVRVFKKLTKNSNHSALAVAWDWFITSIFQLEVDVNNSEHVIFRSD
ncbi:hypothetical protein ZYGR_0AG06370 [Zygosaccharomyces rouxii]|uniref:BRCT domain-containing protein n=1 Tax=Zygosaccharomyces rouxii TaxID=4956 RepID=A0A1Q3AA76_ZYGRO|nr:hypothetical protein ZYGR_0AG06370 [Zygosaccharomyces rouxii]